MIIEKRKRMDSRTKKAAVLAGVGALLVLAAAYLTGTKKGKKTLADISKTIIKKQKKAKALEKLKAKKKLLRKARPKRGFAPKSRKPARKKPVKRARPKKKPTKKRR